MENKTYHITTFGCQMNEHDSEKLAGMLEQMGYSESPSKLSAAVIIINTCSVREHADERFFGTLGQLKKLKLENPLITVAVCGCMMQQQHIVDKLKSKYPWVDLIFGTHNIHEFPKLLENSINERIKTIDVWDENGSIAEGLPVKRKYNFKAFVNIMYGCDNFCSYCIVPYTRGRERSRNPEDIINEINQLVANGVIEVTLLGQNVNSYGNNCEFDMSFAQLIYKLNEINGLSRIRFMTSHPKDLSDDLIEAYKQCDKLANYIHLPIQSGSNAVLNKMNRNYTREDYLELVKKLRQTVPDIAISTDFIVGFPGETETDFLDTLDLVKSIGFDTAFTFLYSVRQGTPAETYKDQIPEALKHQRFNRLVSLLNDSAAAKNKAYIGKDVNVLIEGPSKTDPSIYSGRTESNKLVNVKVNKSEIGNIIAVRIVKANTFSLLAEKI